MQLWRFPCARFSLCHHVNNTAEPQTEGWLLPLPPCPRPAPLKGHAGHGCARQCHQQSSAPLSSRSQQQLCQTCSDSDGMQPSAIFIPEQEVTK